METIMYLIGYNSDFKEHCKSGWGCGYLMIPINHPIIKEWEIQKLNDEENWGYDYLQIGSFDEEITYTQYTEQNSINYVVIGFDTAHSYNNPEINDFNYVFNQTIKLKSIVDAIK